MTSPPFKRFRMASTSTEYKPVCVPPHTTYPRTSDKKCFRVYQSLASTLADDLGQDKIEIVVTEAMLDLYKRVASDKPRRYLLVGPHGIGKTTVIYWLYWQFANQEKYAVYALPLDSAAIENVRANLEAMELGNRALVLCDLNSIETCDATLINALIEVVCEVGEKNGFCIFAASSALFGTMMVCDRRIRSRLLRLQAVLNEYRIETDKAAASSLIDQVCPDNEMKGQLLTESLGNIYSILLRLADRDSFNRVMTSTWKDLDEVIAKSPSEHSSIRKLFISLVYEFPISVFDMTLSEAQSLAPLLREIVCIGDNLIPKLQLPVPLYHIRRTILVLSKVLPETDEASALGYVYERAVLSIIGRQDYQMADQSGNIEKKKLPMLTVANSRFDPETIGDASPNLLWLFPKKEKAVDAFCIESNALILFQISIQQTGHEAKVNKINTISSQVSQMATKYTKLIHVYINPMCSLEDFEKLHNACFAALCKNQSIREKIHFAMPVSLDAFKAIYHDIKTALAPK